MNDEQTFKCWLCRDSPDGWMTPLSCPELRCERTTEHGPHTFAPRCACWLRRNADALRSRQQDLLSKAKPVPPDCYALEDVERGIYRWSRPDVSSFIESYMSPRAAVLR